MIPKGYYAVLYKLSDDSKEIAARFPEHPTINTYGFGWEHAEEMANEALSFALEADYKQGYHLPKANKPKAEPGERIIFVPIDIEVRVAYMLRQLREKSGLTQKDVAQRLGITYQSYQRMERPGRSNLSLSTLARVAQALNKEVVIEMR